MTGAPVRSRGRFWLYAPFGLLAVLVLAWSAYWVWMRGQLDASVDAWIAEQRASGAEIGYASKQLGGFPYRFALTLEEPRFVVPATGQAWQADRLQIVMQPWNLQHIILRSPGRNELVLQGGEPLTAIIGQGSALSFSWTKESFRRFSVYFDTADIVTGSGEVRLQDAALNLSPVPDDPDALRIALDWQGLDLGVAPREAAWLGPASDLGTVRLEVSGAAALLRGEVRPEAWLGGVPRFALAQLLLNWGPLRLGMKGDVSLSGSGCQPDGTLSLRLEEAGALRDALEMTGDLTPEIEAGLAGVELASRNGGFAPVRFREGDILFLGQTVGNAALPVPACASSGSGGG